jgi:hypothetical protein
MIPLRYRCAIPPGKEKDAIEKMEKFITFLAFRSAPLVLV